MTEKKFEITSIYEDANQFYYKLASSTRENASKLEGKITESYENLDVAKKRVQELQNETILMEQNLEVLKKKELDVKAIISDLEKNKAQFKTIVSGQK